VPRFPLSYPIPLHSSLYQTSQRRIHGYDLFYTIGLREYPRFLQIATEICAIPFPRRILVDALDRLLSILDLLLSLSYLFVFRFVLLSLISLLLLLFLLLVQGFLLRFRCFLRRQIHVPFQDLTICLLSYVVWMLPT